MPMSSRDHDAVEALVSSSSIEERAQLKISAEQMLLTLNNSMGRWHTEEERKAAEYAIEILVRIEASERNAGWWFRAKRRLQLVQMYMGN